MEVTKIKTINEMFSSVKQANTPTVAVAVAQELNVLESVHEVFEAGLANFILVGNENLINTIAKDNDLNMNGINIINEVDDSLAIKKAIELVRTGRADVLMKGLVDTSAIMKEVLKKENDFRTDRKLSHLALFELPTYHKLLFVTDAALNIAPDVSVKKDIIQNSILALQNFGIEEPKVAMLCAKEKVTESMPVTLEYQQLKQMWENGEIKGGIVDGPFALDNAVSEESVKIKGIVSPVAGDADILLCPDIEAGNILYKSLSCLANARNGGIVLGAKKPIIIKSRADSKESKIISILLALLCSGGSIDE